MKSYFKKLPQHLQFILSVYFTGMILFSLLRIILVLFHFSEIKSIPFTYIFQSMIIGLRFDTVVSCYFLAIPTVLFFLLLFFKKRLLIPEKIIFGFIILIYSVAFFISCADIPWFNHQQTRLTVAALQWTNTPAMMLKIIFEDIQNYPFLILFFVISYIFYHAVRKIRTKTLNETPRKNSVASSTLIYLFVFGILFIGIRGRIEQKSPIRWGSAFVSQYNLTNQIGLNPIFTLMDSWIDENKDVHFMGETLAIQTVQQYYRIDPEKKLQSPVARAIGFPNPPLKQNVILVIMESMTTRKLGLFGNKNHLTPHLDSIAKQSVLFTHFYSDGIHTFNGIYSTLFGMPSLLMTHHMKDIKNQQPYSGIAKVLSKENYRTIFFTTHDDQFDNMAGFLLPNGFQTIVSERNYPQNKVLSTLGVPDHVMFDDAIQRLNLFHQNNQPFFAAMMTGSDHRPYEIPQDISFHPHSSETGKQAVEYADWAIGHFMEECSRQQWFDSTIFIFTSDHGALIDDADFYLSLHHIPLIIFAPQLLKPAIVDDLGGQTDIFPTLMGMLNISYINNSFGINLFTDKRKFLPFNSDEYLGCMSKECFCVTGKGHTTLFKLWDDERCCDEMHEQQRTDSMFTYSKAIMQTMQDMIRKRQVF